MNALRQSMWPRTCLMEIDSRMAHQVHWDALLTASNSLRAVRGRTSQRAAVGPAESMSHSHYAALGNPSSVDCGDESDAARDCAGDRKRVSQTKLLVV
jgi:hypothetical protein